MNKFTQHQVAEINESKIQHCIICGEIISDYSGVMFPEGETIPKGFQPGNVFVSEGNPIEMKTTLLVGETFVNCQPLF